MKLKEDVPVIAEVAPVKMFDGRFFLSNPYDFDHVCKWNGSEYEFKAKSTSPLFIAEANPLETENIRKKFAIEIGTAAFMRSEKYAEMKASEKITKGGGIPTYVPVLKKDASGKEVLNADSPLAPYVIKCLEPLPVVPVKTKERVHVEPEHKIDPKTGRPVITVLSHEENNSRSLISEVQNL